MNSGDQTTPRLCAHCEYDLAGLPSPVCPECGQEQPEPKPKRLVRPGKSWIGVSVAGVLVFGTLTLLSVLWGTGLGATYTGDQELVEFTIALAIVTGGYAVLCFELWRHRNRLRTRTVEDTWWVVIVIGMSGPLLGFVLYAVLFFLAIMR